VKVCVSATTVVMLLAVLISQSLSFTGGKIVKVVFDVADDAYIDVERHMVAAMSRD
jgi:hypothetical protein